MATKTLSENIEQAINDFNEIKQAIESKGLDVPDGTTTSQYDDLILEIENEVGENLAGKTVSVSYDKETETETTVTASTSSEIFNDYRERIYKSSDGRADRGNVASGEYSHAEGKGTTANGNYAHTEGGTTIASGVASHAEGSYSIAGGICAHAEGSATNASGDYTHAEGGGTTASGKYSHAEGEKTTASAFCAHAEGSNTNALEPYAHSGGRNTIANRFQFVCGKHNTETAGATDDNDTTGDIFIIGNGTYNTRSNAFRVTTAGKVYGLSNFSGSGAGVAELYEWVDGNPNNEDRRGLFVTLEGEKIRIATPNDEYILGVIDPCPYVVGDVQSEIWKDMYLKDVFGEKLIETVEVEETTDEIGEVIPAHTEKRWILNPEFDSTQEYISRDDRSEFVAITSKGKVVLIDDGSCQVNKYCTVGENGIATASENNYAVRVMERIDDTHIKVYIDSVFVNKKS